MIIFSSGTTEIILKTRNTLSNLRRRKLELFGIGIKDIQTIKVSKIFHPLLKNFDFLGSPINRIIISITKKISNGNIFEIKSIKQDMSKTIKKSFRKDFTDDVVQKFYNLKINLENKNFDYSLYKNCYVWDGREIWQIF